MRGTQAGSARRGFLHDVGQLAFLDVADVFAAGFQLFESFHDGLRHLLVRLLRAAENEGFATLNPETTTPEAALAFLASLANP